MKTIEARRTRHLVVQLSRGDELPGALVRALDEAEVKSASISGSGTCGAVELATSNGDRKCARRFEGTLAIASLHGRIVNAQGARTPILHATIARELDRGLDVLAGELVWARAIDLELHLVALDDAPAAEVAAPPPLAPSASTSSSEGSPPVPVKQQRASDDLEFYPEPGDTVTHFLFGECVVLSSDGDRIRLRQDKDGRVREVALTMLKIDPPVVDPESKKRHFNLLRKN